MGFCYSDEQRGAWTTCYGMDPCALGYVLVLSCFLGCSSEVDVEKREDQFLFSGAVEQCMEVSKCCQCDPCFNWKGCKQDVYYTPVPLYSNVHLLLANHVFIALFAADPVIHRWSFHGSIDPLLLIVWLASSKQRIEANTHMLFPTWNFIYCFGALVHRDL